MITKKMIEAKDFLNARFNYVLDNTQYGTPEYWVRMEVANSMEGDCEDYAMAILDHLVDYSGFEFYKALFTKEAKLHYLTVSGNGHCMLEYKGYYIDNNYRSWVRKDQISSNFVFKWRYNLFIICGKLTIAKVRSWFN